MPSPKPDPATVDGGDLMAAIIADMNADADAAVDFDLVGHMRTMLGGDLTDGVVEISRRRLAAARHAIDDPNIESTYAEFNLAAAVAEYRGFGGNPDTVAGDWVQAWSPQHLWRNVPADTATWDTETRRWISDWVDDLDNEAAVR